MNDRTFDYKNSQNLITDDGWKHQEDLTNLSFDGFDLPPELEETHEEKLFWENQDLR